MSDETVPEVGETISAEDLDMIFDAVGQRQSNFPNEPIKLSFFVVMKGIGDRFRKVQCIEQEWEGYKKDIPRDGEGDLKCPNGHSLHEGPGITIGWIPVTPIK